MAENATSIDLPGEFGQFLLVRDIWGGSIIINRQQ